MSQHGSQATSSCLVATYFFHVATVLCFFVVTISRQWFPCCDRDGQDKRSSVAIGLALGRDFIPRQSVFMSR